MNEKRIQSAARGQESSVRLLGVCNHNPETTVLAHVSGIRFGHGIGKKTKWGAFCCSSCHDVLDGRVPRPAGMTYEQAKLAHYEGVIETLNRLEGMGVI